MNWVSKNTKTKKELVDLSAIPCLPPGRKENLSTERGVLLMVRRASGEEFNKEVRQDHKLEHCYDADDKTRRPNLDRHRKAFP